MANPDALKSAFDAATSNNEWATALVVLGLIVEFAALLLFSKDMPRKEKVALVIGSIMVAVGVGGEYVFGGRAASAAKALQQTSDEKIAGLKGAQESDHKIAAKAAAYAASLGVTVKTLPDFVDKKEKEFSTAFDSFKSFSDNEKKRDDAIIAELNADKANFDKVRNDATASATEAKNDLAKLEKEIEADRARRERLEQRFVWRNLNGEQQKKFSATMSTFKKARFDLSVIENDPEALAFGVELAVLLKQAGWEWVEYNHPNGPFMTVTSIKGFPNIGHSGAAIDVFVGVNQDHEAQFWGAAKSLTATLLADQIPAACSQIYGDDGGIPNHDTLHVVVGKKIN